MRVVCLVLVAALVACASPPPVEPRPVGPPPAGLGLPAWYTNRPTATDAIFDTGLCEHVADAEQAQALADADARANVAARVLPVLTHAARILLSEALPSDDGALRDTIVTDAAARASDRARADAVIVERVVGNPNPNDDGARPYFTLARLDLAPLARALKVELTPSVIRHAPEHAEAADPESDAVRSAVTEALADAADATGPEPPPAPARDLSTRRRRSFGPTVPGVPARRRCQFLESPSAGTVLRRFVRFLPLPA